MSIRWTRSCPRTGGVLHAGLQHTFVYADGQGVRWGLRFLKAQRYWTRPIRVPSTPMESLRFDARRARPNRQDTSPR